MTQRMLTSDAVAWAAYLGANTPARLANEWRIPYAQAERLLLEAAAADKRTVFSVSGVYAANAWRVAVPA